MPKTTQQLQREITDKLNHIGILERDSKRKVTSESSRNRIEYLKDYTYIGLTSIGIISTIIASSSASALIQSEILVFSALALLAISTVYALVARAKLIHDAESISIFIENQYASKYEITEQLAMAPTQEVAQKLVNDLDVIRAQVPPKQERWVASAHEFILYPFIGGLVLACLSFTVKSILQSLI